MSKKGTVGLILGLAVVGGLGYWIGRGSAKFAVGSGTTERRDIGTLARNFRTTCDTLNPLLARLEAAYADGRLAPDELLGILGGVGQLV